jgi:hypothetical protein
VSKEKLAEVAGGVWIFQSNPDIFDLDGYLQHGSGRLAWEVNQYADRIADGDTVYLWRAVSKAVRAKAAAAAAKPYSRAAKAARLATRAGIVGVARVVGPVFRGVDNTDGADFRMDLALPEMRNRVHLQVLGNANGREAIRREWLMGDPVCHRMVILDRPPDTNVPVTAEEAARLALLWERTGQPMTYEDLVAVLHCYSQVRAADPAAGSKRTWSTGAPRTPDKHAHAAIDRAVADTAVLIGRATGSVKLAIAKYRAIDPGYPGRGLHGATSVYHTVFHRFWDAEAGRIRTNDLDAEHGRLWLGITGDGLLI